VKMKTAKVDLEKKGGEAYIRLCTTVVLYFFLFLLFNPETLNQ
jgi:hypothetical protein